MNDAQNTLTPADIQRPVLSASSTSSSTTTATTNSSQPSKRPGSSSGVGGGVRLPTLNQLAARITHNATAKGEVPLQASTLNASRPRLAAFAALRTGSQSSLTTTASNADSMAVNPPSTRSVSPAMSAESHSAAVTSSGTPGLEGGDGEPLTEERVEKFNQEIGAAVAVVAGTEGTSHPVIHVSVGAADQAKRRVGYKNIPSLDAITARIAKQRAMSLSVDGSANPPEPEMIEDPKTPGVSIKPPEHPLQFTWTIYHDTKSKLPFTPHSAGIQASAEAPYSAQPPDGQDYEAGLTIIGEFSTVEEFCRYFNWLKPPSKLEKNSNYHLFKSGIKPMWEDPANANGGKWVLTMKNNPGLLDRCWNWLAFALVGEELEEGDEICGAVVSLRSKVDRIQLWMRGKEDVEKINSMGKRLVKLLDVSEADSIGLEFQYNSEDRPPPNKFLSIQAMPTSSFRSSFQQTAASPAPPNPSVPARQFTGEAFGGFGTGVGIGGWKGARKQ